MARMTTALLLAILVAPLPAQTLAHSLPADVLVYFRGQGSLDELKQRAGAGSIWSSPFDTEEILSSLDQALSEAENMFGFEGGSLSAYIKSIQSVEGALYRLELTDDIPEMDFAVVIQLPQADEFYKLLSGALVENMLGDLNDEGELEVTGDEFGMNAAQRDDKIIIASDQRRLRETIASFGTVRAGSLAQTPTFKFVCEPDAAKGLLYVRLKEFIRMGLENVPSRTRMMGVGVAGLLGLTKLEALGYSENDKHTRVALKAGAPVPLLQIHASGSGKPTLLEQMPAETGFGIVYAGNLEEAWKKASQVLLSEESPMAALMESGLMEFEKETGLKPEEVARLGRRGFGFGVIPDEFGRLDDDGFFLSMVLDDPQTARNFADEFLPRLAKQNRRNLDVSQEGEEIWYRFLRKSGRLDGCLCLRGDRAVAGGLEDTVRKVMASLQGQHPTLKSAGALKGISAKGAGFFYLSLRAIMANEHSFAPALSRLTDTAGIAASVEVFDDRAVLLTNKPLSEVFTAFGMARAHWDAMAEKRRVHRDNLRKIAEACKTYVERTGKAPKSLADLGFTGKNALKGPMMDGKREDGTSLYVLLGPAPKQGENEFFSWSHILAYCKDTRFGRIVVNDQGYAYAMPEARFRYRLASQSGKASKKPQRRGERLAPAPTREVKDKKN